MARLEGRRAEEIRKLKITRSYIKHAEGSCLIELGDTKVICAASVEESVPPFLKGSGNGWLTAEYAMLPRSTLTRINRERDKISGRTFEIQRLIGRSLRSVFDTQGLGERTIKIDCDVIQADGGTRTAAITGSFIALIEALDRLKRSGALQSIPVEHYVAATSVGIVDSEFLLDLNYQEDSRAQVDMNVVMTSQERFVEIQGTAEKRSFDKAQMDRMLELSVKGISKLFQAQKEVLKGLM